MSILWCGGEDIDFPNGTAVLTSTTSGYFRSSYARVSLYGSYGGTSSSLSSAFVGGAVTTAWISAQIGGNTGNNNGSQNSNTARLLGLGNTSLLNGTGIYICNTAAFGLSISKWDGTTQTVLASGSPFMTNGINLFRVDMSITNYGASSVINLYVNGNLYASFSGSSTISGLSNFNSAVVASTISGNTSQAGCASEIIVADEDTRSFSLRTMAPTGAGTTSQWTGLFSALNPTTINDANSNFTNTVAQDQEFTVATLPTGVFAVRLVKATTRCAATAGSTATKVGTGFKISSTVYPGTAQGPLGTAYTDYEQYYTANPATSTDWTTTDLGSLQLDLRSS
jgi:hypothetical protein